MNKIFALGGIQSEPDYRDIPLSAVLGAPANLPQSYRVDDLMLPIWNQKKIGACVGHAGAKKKQRQEYKETGKILTMNPRFNYALAKSIDGLPAGMEGTYYRLALKVQQKFGIPEETPEYSNNTDLSHSEYIDLSKIPAAVYENAKKFAIKSYAQVGGTYAVSAEQLMQGIVESEGVLLGVQVGKEWWTNKQGASSWSAADLLPIRPPAAVVSGHAIYGDGYEIVGDSKLKVWFINSWTKEWADGGRGWFWFDDYKNAIVEAWASIDLPNNWLELVEKLPSAETFRHTFAIDLEIGQTSEEVKHLQTALMIDGEFDKELYKKLLINQELGFYGDITRQAARAFQFKYKVAPASELNAVNGRRIGLKTRKKLNELFSIQ